MENTIIDQNNKIQLFKDKRIRTAWDEEDGLSLVLGEVARLIVGGSCSRKSRV